jgi:hypothetical protein
MWTLAVEEQFYILWPLILMALSFFEAKRWKLIAIAAAIASSFFLSVYFVDRNPNAAFYLLPARAWELGIGAALSIYGSSVRSVLSNGKFSKLIADGVSITGLLFIGISVVVYSSSTAFPGAAALLPCLGAALYIASSEASPSAGGRLLSWRPIVLVGEASYSLYLWHWPVLVFGRLIAIHPLDAYERFGLAGLALAISFLSLRYIEAPFRGKSFPRITAKSWVASGLILGAIFAAAGAAIFVENGFVGRSPQLEARFEQEKSEAVSFQVSPCLARGSELPSRENCLMGTKSIDYQVVLWGDSYAAHLVPAVDQTLTQLGLSGRQITKAGCPPTPGLDFLPKSEALLDCAAFNKNALESILADKAVRVILIAGRWDWLLNGITRVTLTGSRSSVAASRRLFIDGFRATIATLSNSGRRVIIVGQVPTPDESPIECRARAEFQHRDISPCETAPVEMRATIEAEVSKVLTDIRSNLPRVKVLLPYSKICDADRCYQIEGGQPLYMDESHLSALGSKKALADLNFALSN